MTRRYDWQTRLQGALQKGSQQRFELGSHDCCLFSCTLIKALVGVDPGKEFRGKYDDARGWLKALKTIGSGDLTKTVEDLAAKHGFFEVDIRKAQRGDLVLIVQDGKAAAMSIVDLTGANLVFADDVAPIGFRILPLKEIIKKGESRAWRVD